MMSLSWQLRYLLAILLANCPNALDTIVAIDRRITTGLTVSIANSIVEKECWDLSNRIWNRDQIILSLVDNMRTKWSSDAPSLIYIVTTVEGAKGLLKVGEQEYERNEIVVDARVSGYENEPEGGNGTYPILEGFGRDKSFRLKIIQVGNDHFPLIELPDNYDDTTRSPLRTTETTLLVAPIGLKPDMNISAEDSKKCDLATTFYTSFTRSTDNRMSLKEALKFSGFTNPEIFSPTLRLTYLSQMAQIDREAITQSFDHKKQKRYYANPLSAMDNENDLEMQFNGDVLCMQTNQTLGQNVSEQFHADQFRADNNTFRCRVTLFNYYAPPSLLQKVVDTWWYACNMDDLSESNFETVKLFFDRVLSKRPSLAERMAFIALCKEENLVDRLISGLNCFDTERMGNDDVAYFPNRDENPMNGPANFVFKTIFTCGAESIAFACPYVYFSSVRVFKSGEMTPFRIAALAAAYETTCFNIRQIIDTILNVDIQMREIIEKMTNIMEPERWIDRHLPCIVKTGMEEFIDDVSLHEGFVRKMYIKLIYQVQGTKMYGLGPASNIVLYHYDSKIMINEKNLRLERYTQPHVYDGWFNKNSFNDHEKALLKICDFTDLNPHMSLQTDKFDTIRDKGVFTYIHSRTLLDHVKKNGKYSHKMLGVFLSGLIVSAETFKTIPKGVLLPNAAFVVVNHVTFDYATVCAVRPPPDKESVLNCLTVLTGPPYVTAMKNGPFESDEKLYLNCGAVQNSGDYAIRGKFKIGTEGRSDGSDPLDISDPSSFRNDEVSDKCWVMPWAPWDTVGSFNQKKVFFLNGQPPSLKSTDPLRFGEKSDFTGKYAMSTIHDLGMSIAKLVCFNARYNHGKTIPPTIDRVKVPLESAIKQVEDAKERPNCVTTSLMLPQRIVGLGVVKNYGAALPTRWYLQGHEECLAAKGNYGSNIFGPNESSHPMFLNGLNSDNFTRHQFPTVDPRKNLIYPATGLANTAPLKYAT